jgi:hypothetical protein
VRLEPETDALIASGVVACFSIIRIEDCGTGNRDPLRKFPLKPSRGGKFTSAQSAL